MIGPLKVAIVGGGPSAFYVAGRLLKLQTAESLRVHIFDRLWSPHGLVRYGVAPDHADVKNCTHKFDETAKDPRFRFFGNVNIGDGLSPIPHALNVPLASIFSNYSHVVFATGCTLPKLHSALPPSSHSIPALDMVHWYTQHPNAPSNPPPLDKITHVSLIGNGNVSLDIARILLSHIDVLKRCDIPQPVLEVLAESRVERVSIIGRRGPLEAAFTMKELRQLTELPDVSMVPMDTTLLQAPEGIPLTRQQTRGLQLLSKGSKTAFGSGKKTWSLDFYRSPTGLDIHPPHPHDSSRPRATLSLAHTMVDPSTKRAVETGESSQLTTDLVVTSMGFHGEPTASFYDPSMGHLRTVGNQMIDTTGKALRHVYASGWAATGAKGVLATTLLNAFDVAQTVVRDHMEHPDNAEQNPGQFEYTQVLNPEPDLDAVPEEVQKGLDRKDVFTYTDWKKIDEEEIRRGEFLGKERERVGWEEAKALLSSH
ncbi:ferrodoxin-NADP(+) reductase [Coprinopsis marcescibilis]|uniref:NADPH:adrenodoxin oxidoreductase, mitochondrial n=1 Tax=Coprinopsis marcescibilis TaxID=230819 RepID=A0A5C3KH93_COPMA|nr:ferrodoxin-NADP(+) reductase [Coprinopsis marcescibilis]